MALKATLVGAFTSQCLETDFVSFILDKSDAKRLIQFSVMLVSVGKPVPTESYCNRSSWMTQLSSVELVSVLGTMLSTPVCRASVLAGILDCNIGQICIECIASTSCVHSSACNDNMRPVFSEFIVEHIFPSSMCRHFVYGRIL